MATRHTIAVDFGRRRLRAVETSTRGGVLTIDRAVVRDIPKELDANDVERAGEWLRDQLKREGFGRGRTTFVLARDQVALKRLSLPTSEADELPDMTRLAVQRDLPFDPEHAVIDFVPVTDEGDSTTVLAVAASETAIQEIYSLAKAAGLSVGRIALRGLGSAMLVKHDGEAKTSNGVLVIDIIGEGVEFCVVADGAIRMSRATQLPTTVMPQRRKTDGGEGDGEPEKDVDFLSDTAKLAEAVVTEVRRTWMSYRMTEESVDIDRVVIMGDPSVAEFVKEPIRKLLKVPVAPLESHPCVEAATRDVRSGMPVIWPLAGLLLGDLFEEETIDLAHPRKRPDHRAEHRRRWAMAGALVVILLIGGKMTADRFLSELDDEIASITGEIRDGQSRARQAMRDGYRVQHLKHWESVEVNWLDHFSAIHQHLPSPELIVLDGWSGALNFGGVDYDEKAKEGERWSTPASITMSLDGEAKDRTTADSFRAMLVNSSMYTVETSGADKEGGKRLPDGFTFRLSTRKLATEDESEAPASDEKSARESARKSAREEDAS